MQDKNYIKSFPCSLHPSEAIQRISIENNVDDPLKCLECIVNDSHQTSKDFLLPINDFIEKIISQYQHLPQTSFNQTPLPREFIEFLAHKEVKIQRLSGHIEQEKEKVNLVFDSLIEEFIKICHSRKEKLIDQLDKQLVALQLNYQYYKNKINKYFQNQNDFYLNNQETFLEKINQCQDTNYLEFLIKNIKEDLLEFTLHYQPANIFPSLAQDLQQQSDFFPKSQFSNQDNLDSQLREIMDSFFGNVNSIEPQISNLSFINSLSLDSQLVQKQDERYLLKKWLTPNHEDLQLKLLFRGSRDGMNLQAFHERCNDYPNTLVIAKSSFGNILGGFSDHPWSNAAVGQGFKKSEKAFLFSMTKKQKFPIMPHKDAVYVGPNYGLAFGTGHDLLLYFDENMPRESYACYSVLGRSYQLNTNTKNDPPTDGGLFFSEPQGPVDKILLAGAEKFHVEEIEVYTVKSK